MTDIVQADYEELAHVVARFEQQADQIIQLLQSLQQGYRSLAQGGWMGQGSEVFSQEMEGVLLPAISRLGDALALAAQTTTQITTVLQDADQEASAGFSNGSPDGATGSISAGGTGSSPTGDLSVPDDWLSGVTDELTDSSETPEGDSTDAEPASGAETSLTNSPGEAAAGDSPVSPSSGAAGGATPSGNDLGEATLNDSGSFSDTGGASSIGDGSLSSGRTGVEASASGGNSPNLGHLNPQLGDVGGGQEPATSPTTWGGAAAPTPAGQASEDQGGLGLPIGLAAAAPFAALFGKAVKDKLSENQDDKEDH